MLRYNTTSRQRHWIARIDEIPPGERKIINVEGHQLGIFNVQGTFVTILNICPHEQAPICYGHIDGTTLSSSPGEFRWGREGEILRCPWHGWEFDLLTGKALVDKRRLRRYPTVVENEDIYVIL